MKSNCLNCSNEIEVTKTGYKNGKILYRKFCNQSCAAKFNNKTPKRKLSKLCKNCGTLIFMNRTYCSRVCNLLGQRKRSIEFWDDISLKDIKAEGNANFGGRYPYIRSLSRTKYLKSDRPKKCVICGYSLHFDVCHIKDIKSFPITSLISEINSLTNLVAMCKNHHWEFDNGFLSWP